MKPFGLALAAAALLLAGCGSQPGLRAGAAVADITPKEWPLPLIGNFGYSPASAANDPLSVRAIVVESGGETIAVAVVDSCYLPTEVADDAKARASERSGIPTDHILLSATHTHSAPPASPMLDWKPGGPPEVEPNMEAYSELLRNGVAQAVADAHSRLEPAELGWGKVEIPEELHNRRWFMKEGTIPPDPFGATTDKVKMNPPRQSPDLIKPAGPTDPELYVVSVRSEQGAPLALWATYSLHYVGGVPSGKVSADYFGEFARRISASMRQEGAGDDFVGMLANGTSGDVNNIDFEHERAPAAPFERIHQVAERVARGAFDAYKTIGYHRSLDVAMIQRADFEAASSTAEGLEQAKQFLAEPDETKLPRLAKACGSGRFSLPRVRTRRRSSCKRCIWGRWLSAPSRSRRSPRLGSRSRRRARSRTRSRSSSPTGGMATCRRPSSTS
ncbi:MAG: hypothetical protein R2724_27300 [Bryobacterales bacterium]